MQQNEKVLKKGIFKRITYSSAKKYACEKGELTLTTKNLAIDCKGSWSKTFPIKKIRLEAWGENLEVYDNWYGRLLFKLIIDSAKEWKETHDKVMFEWAKEEMRSLEDEAKKRPTELKRLFDISPQALKKLYINLRKERLQFERKNIRLNLDVQWLLRTRSIKNRKLQAFIVAHSYVAWYEWTKRLLYKIFKAKFGKGPANDEELLKFLDDYPSWKGFLDTTEWGIRANQIRNCVSHEKFYFDYKPSELVFMANKEKRVRFRELEMTIYSMSHFYATLLRSLEEKITKGQISYESPFSF